MENVSLKDVQQKIEVDQQEYELVGVIECKPNRKHFIAHILRGNEWITHDDLETKTSKGNVAEKVVLITYRRASTMTNEENCSPSSTRIHNTPNKIKEIDTTKPTSATPEQEKSSMVLRKRNR